MNNYPMVSVCMITYGHEKYIEEAILSILMQECKFEIELIISNDCSPDSTDKIVKNIIETHQKGYIIKYIRQEKNIGMMPNFIFALKQCKGKYVALCEGDDFWTNSKKLQKQVEFLENNNEYVLSFHNAEVHNNFTNNTYLFLENYDVDKFEITDIFERWIIPTASMVYRNNFGNVYPDYFNNATHGDFGLQLYLSKFGKFKGFNDVLSVYRINQSSVTANSFSTLNQNKRHINQLNLMNDYFEKKYDTQIKKRIFLFYLINANTYKNKSITKPLYWISKAIIANPRHMLFYRKNLKDNFYNIFKTFKYLLKANINKRLLY
ncbi:glycosyltransferase [Flavobacterium capsici]|uniref:Glycosyltransferase n=1 Tax=Flavobacterium capsici TaxID=3075618 RepID=A0AA96J3H1_9FLAO|nr:MULTISPECIES: glycosyltransferase [unclassified Flavobacterium]WNM20250.1 glycosyltransferase [Flavobacterium sp. PMR2A8]WNM21640.1 glycosyltransferase [Flavobacterium sp. PMTSA4]